MNFWFEDDGYGIVGWSFKCKHCGKDNRFCLSPQDEMCCEYCNQVNIFTSDEIDYIDNNL